MGKRKRPSSKQGNEAQKQQHGEEWAVVGPSVKLCRKYAQSARRTGSSPSSALVEHLRAKPHKEHLQGLGMQSSQDAEVGAAGAALFLVNHCSKEIVITEQEFLPAAVPSKSFCPLLC